jgi:hypothetical protein
VLALAWSPDERELAFLQPIESTRWPDRNYYKLCVLDIGTGKKDVLCTTTCWASREVYTGGMQFIQLPLVWSNDGKSIYVATEPRAILRIDRKTGKKVKVADGCVPVIEEGENLLYFADEPLRLQSVSLKTGLQVKTFFCLYGAKGFGRCFVSPDKTRFGLNCTRGYYHAILIWGGEKKIIGVLPVYEPLIGWCTIPPENKAILRKQSRSSRSSDKFYSKNPSEEYINPLMTR